MQVHESEWDSEINTVTMLHLQRHYMPLVLLSNCCVALQEYLPLSKLRNSFLPLRE